MPDLSQVETRETHTREWIKKPDVQKLLPAFPRAGELAGNSVLQWPNVWVSSKALIGEPSFRRCSLQLQSRLCRRGCLVATAGGARARPGGRDSSILAGPVMRQALTALGSGPSITTVAVAGVRMSPAVQQPASLSIIDRMPGQESRQPRPPGRTILQAHPPVGLVYVCAGLQDHHERPVW
ncbi:hypothetical protein LX36DRAFT_391367 [Colletotrichum falcatum]|nr:hypothetical protein LX36DRAFT_391367 [Colletotrichum falcatum]